MAVRTVLGAHALPSRKHTRCSGYCYRDEKWVRAKLVTEDNILSSLVTLSSLHVREVVCKQRAFSEIVVQYIVSYTEYIKNKL